MTQKCEYYNVKTFIDNEVADMENNHPILIGVAIDFHGTADLAVLLSGAALEKLIFLVTFFIYTCYVIPTGLCLDYGRSLSRISAEPAWQSRPDEADT